MSYRHQGCVGQEDDTGNDSDIKCHQNKYTIHISTSDEMSSHLERETTVRLAHRRIQIIGLVNTFSNIFSETTACKVPSLVSSNNYLHQLEQLLPKADEGHPC